MKKRIVTLLCTAVLTLGLTMAPAMASGGPFYPIKVEEYTYGPLDELRINKVYQLSLSDDPSGIPTEDFVRGGRQYYLLDMIKEDEVGVDTQDYTDTITVDSDTNDLSKILKQLDAHREVTTEDGYTGLLALDYTSGQGLHHQHPQLVRHPHLSQPVRRRSGPDSQDHHGWRQDPDPGRGGVVWRREWFLHRHRHLHRHLQHPRRHRLHGNGQLHRAGGKDRL